MTPQARRIVIPFIVAGIALTLVAVTVLNKGTPPSTTTPPAETAEPTTDVAADAADGSATPDGTLVAGAPDTEPDAAPDAEPASAVDLPEGLLEGLIAHAPADGETDPKVIPRSIGSVDPEQAKMEIRFVRESGAGIGDLVFSNLWETASDRRQAARHDAEIEDGGTATTPVPSDAQRYHLLTTLPLDRGGLWVPIDVPAFSLNQVSINGRDVRLQFPINKTTGLPDQGAIWSELSPGVFATEIANGSDTPILRIERRFEILHDFDLAVRNRLINLTDQPLDVKIWQYGPGDLRVDRSRYMDRRRFRFGWLMPDRNDPNLKWLNAGTDHLYERSTIVKRDEVVLWPNEDSVGDPADPSDDQELAWFGSTNRYFGVTVHPLPAADGTVVLSLTNVVESIIHEKGNNPSDTSGKGRDPHIFTYLVSPSRIIAPGQSTDYDMGLLAGPLERHLLEETEVYSSLKLDELILYQMSSFCAFCTFQWLAHGLIDFLSLLHNYVLFDWGFAIIGLVCVVRTILHPITKKSQINMQRFGKVMQAVKPEMDKLQKKYGDDPKRMQGEQMRLMGEYGVNPLHMLGCLPMFMQTPIWIALYAMLYFAFDIRQEPAFFGAFQFISGGAWPFLGDLSSADHFFGEFENPVKVLGIWNITGLNILPLLMGAVFFVQQKYLSPPPSPGMSDDQVRQQKLMKIMMVVLFPVMLYSAPSGLTLYILTSSTIGIIESRYVRSHVDAMEIAPKKKGADGKDGAKPKGALGRAYMQRVKRMEEQRRDKKRGPVTKFKKRK